MDRENGEKVLADKRVSSEFGPDVKTAHNI